MKKNEEMLLTLFRADGQPILERRLTSIPLKEEAVLRLSVEFFDDPEPCMIHRSAVMSRMYMELYEHFHAKWQEGMAEHSIADLPQRLASFLDVPGCTTIHVYVRK